MPNHVHLIIFIRKLSVETPIYRVSGNWILEWDTINGCLYENKQHKGTINGCLYENKQHKDTINGCLYDNLNWWSLMKNKNLMLHKYHIWFMIRKLKWKTTFLIHRFVNREENIFFAWQPNYYDRIIRNEDELQRIRKYILENPIKWEIDKNNTENIFM
jgi:REP element-mobilizing transposase RayT